MSTLDEIIDKTNWLKTQSDSGTVRVEWVGDGEFPPTDELLNEVTELRLEIDLQFEKIQELEHDNKLAIERMKELADRLDSYKDYDNGDIVERAYVWLNKYGKKL